MAKYRRRRIWWWIAAAILIAAGLGYYWYAGNGRTTETRSPANVPTSVQRPGTLTAGQETGAAGGPSVSAPIPKPTPAEGGPAAGESPAEKEEKPAGPPELASQGPVEELLIKAEGTSKAARESPDQQAYCALIQERVSEFFNVIESKAYFRRHRLEKGAYSHFVQVLKRLAARTPQPAGEENQLNELISNIFFFFRTLEKNDIALIREVIANERDTLEFDLDIFYRWLMLGKACPDPAGARPSFDVVYRYAGFFLNTTGGRAYLFRRPLRLRLLVSYYSLLVLYQADRLGKNTFGIDVVPFIQPLKEEFQHHPDLEHQEEYLDTLNRIEGHYQSRR